MHEVIPDSIPYLDILTLSMCYCLLGRRSVTSYLLEVRYEGIMKLIKRTDSAFSVSLMGLVLLLRGSSTGTG